MKNILKTAKSVLIPLWLTAAAATNAAVQNTFVGSAARPLDLKKCDLKNVWYKKNGSEIFEMKQRKSRKRYD